MTATKKHLAIALAALVAAALAIGALAGCSAQSSQSSSNAGGETKGTVTVGSKNFTEGDVLSEIYALALEDHGYTVNRSFDISSSVIHTAITSGDIDLYPEYTGTALLSILQLPMETDTQQVYDTVKTAYKQQFDLDVLDQAQASDSQGLVITKKAADQYNIKTISDLQQHASDLRFASQGEFDQREDGIPALEAAYGPFNWKDHQVIDNGLKYEVLKNDEADVAPAYTTEGQLTDPDFVVLQDDKHVWPPYNVIPVVRGEVLSAHPDIADIINSVDEKIDTQTLTELNAKVDIEKEEYADVAKDFYDSIK